MHDDGYFDDHVAAKCDKSAADKFDQRSSGRRAASRGSPSSTASPRVTKP
jgi:hypothetical protein